jgi:hypothetical protein
MESQGKYDYAILGEGLATWVAALLLSRQGDRVLIIPERQEKREFVGRILFGLETDGILLRMLERWGLSKAVLKGRSRARMECLTPETSLWIQGSLVERGLGTPGFELEGPAYEKLLKVVETMEEQTEWKSAFEAEFISRVKFTTDKRMHWVPFLPDTAATWKRIVRKVVSPQAKGIRLPREKSSVGEGAGRLLRGLGHLLSREESWVQRAPKPIQIASDLFALRNAYFSDEIFDTLRDEFRRILRASGVEFLSDDARPHFKRDSSGTWEGISESDPKDRKAGLFRFENLILSRQLDPETLSRFEESSRKNLELDLDIQEYDRYELEVRFQQNPFPFREPAELVSRSPSGGWVRLSVYQDPKPSVRVGAWVPVGSITTKNDAKIVAERRLLREIRESLPGLRIDSDHTEISTEIHRERRFKRRIGVKGKASHVWHAHHRSYPQMGEYGPILAAIEIARRRARKKKRILPL